jgi:hypothetical protein
MKEIKLPAPELGLIAATRGMLGAGIGLLLAGKLDEEPRNKVGWTLFLIGALSTVPLVIDVLSKRQPAEEAPGARQSLEPTDRVAAERFQEYQRQGV